MKNNPKVLVVDDDANLRKTLSDILKVKGYAVATAANGAEAIAEAQRAAVNVALIDLKLPDMSGIAVMERIKAASPHTEAIILTGHASLNTAVEAINKGAYSYLLKPYEIDNLLLHIRHASERQQAQDEIRRLASFPRLNPMPVIEVAPSCEVTYTNPAADKMFPDLRLLDGHHPLLIGLGDIYDTFRQDDLTEMVREVTIGEASYERHIYYIPESKLIRITVLNITERKLAEDNLAASEALLKEFIRYTPAAIAMLDTQMRYIQTSERWIRDYHLSDQDIVGKSHYEIFPDVPQRWRDIHQRALAGATERCDEDQFLRADGSIEWLQWEVRPWRKAGGEIGGVIFFTQVITERKQAETKLAEQLEELRRWHDVTLGREGRVLDLKHEVNDLLSQTGKQPRYPSTEP